MSYNVEGLQQDCDDLRSLARKLKKNVFERPVIVRWVKRSCDKLQEVMSEP